MQNIISTFKSEMNWTDLELSELENDLLALSEKDLVDASWLRGDNASNDSTSKIIKIVTPRVVKNDIRRYFSNMFMNTVNSADFHRTEDFFRTFMANDCTFVSQQELGSEFRVPSALHTVGPRLFAHYLLGCFVMYPDMALSMSDTKIVTSSTWTGTKIVMQVEYKLTKTCDIPLECWVPPATALSRVYSASTIVNMVSAIRAAPQGRGKKNVTPTSTGDFAEKVPRKRGRPPQLEDTPRMYIPERYIKALQDGAVNLLSPCKLHVKGEFVLFLDERHLIQHAVLSGTQLN